jgi:CheY-like chemotaxis protein
MMGGRIWVESEPGQGSAFHFTAQLELQHAADIDTQPAVGGPRSHHSLRILLAEDNAINQQVAIRTLEKAGHWVELAGNGREALAALEQGAFDLVLMDVQMPEMDGLEATAAIRRREQDTRRHIPIIALTAHAMKGDRERFLAAGMDGCVTKPIRKEELWKALAGCVSRPNLERGPGPEGDLEQTLDRAALLDRLDGDRDAVVGILHLSSPECRRLLANVQQAVLGGDAQRIRQTTHTLKGLLGTLGASKAGAAAGRLEEIGKSGDLTGADAAFTVLQRQIQRLGQALDQFSAELASGRSPGRSAERARSVHPVTDGMAG